MRLLLLTSRLPYPPDRGDRLRVFNFLQYLSGEHDLTLVSFIAHPDERTHVEALQAYCRAVHVVSHPPLKAVLAAGRGLAGRLPLQAAYYRSKAMQRLVTTVTADTAFDAVYIHLFRMAPYAASLRHLYRILDLTDVVSSEIEQSLPFRRLPSRLLYTLERPRVARYECVAAKACDETWLIAEADRRRLCEACPDAVAHIVPNGVDAERFRPLDIAADPAHLLFVGHLRVLHNIDAAEYLAREILPSVRARLPHAYLTLAGADPAPRVSALSEGPGVAVTGYVADLNRLLNRATVFVAPMRFAAGVQNKVLEAMAAGRPVVTTTRVNEGLGAVPGRDLLVEDDPAVFAEQVAALCGDPARQAALGAAARAFVTARFSWSRVGERMRAVEAKVSGRPTPRGHDR